MHSDARAGQWCCSQAVAWVSHGAIRCRPRIHTTIYGTDANPTHNGNNIAEANLMLIENAKNPALHASVVHERDARVVVFSCDGSGIHRMSSPNAVSALAIIQRSLCPLPTISINNNGFSTTSAIFAQSSVRPSFAANKRNALTSHTTLNTLQALNSSQHLIFILSTTINQWVF
jgi:hypothetical protein